MNLNKIANTLTAIETYASLKTFKTIFFHDDYRAVDIYHYFIKNKTAQTIYVKMSIYEIEMFDKFFNEVFEKNTYDEMCKVVQET